MNSNTFTDITDKVHYYITNLYVLNINFFCLLTFPEYCFMTLIFDKNDSQRTIRNEEYGIKNYNSFVIPCIYFFI